MEQLAKKRADHRLRIAIFTDTYPPEINGVAKVTERLVQYLISQNIAVKVFAPKNRFLLGQSSEDPHLHSIRSMPFLFYRQCRMAIPLPKAINRELRLFAPTLIHVMTPFNLGLYGTVYGKRMGIPVVGTYHTNFDILLDAYHMSFFKKFYWNYTRWFYEDYTRIYVPSYNTLRRIKKHHVHQDVEVCGNGIDIQLFRPQLAEKNMWRQRLGLANKKILLYVGRISAEKKVDTVFSIYEQLPQQVKENTQLVIVGDGPLLKHLRETYAGQNVTFTGFLRGNELANLYAEADAFLFPSFFETFGIVVLEAMASGTPVIGANAGGVANLITHGKDGLLCKKDQLQQFVAMTTEILTNTQLRDQLSLNARTTACNYSWHAIFKQQINSYSNIIENAQTHTRWVI